MPYVRFSSEPLNLQDELFAPLTNQASLASIDATLDAYPWAIGASDHRGRPLINIAVAHHRADVVRSLIRRGALTFPNDLPDHRGEGPLHAAVRARDMECLHLLLDGGADPSELSLEGLSPIALAEAHQLPEFAEKMRARVKPTDANGQGD